MRNAYFIISIFTLFNTAILSSELDYTVYHDKIIAAQELLVDEKYNESLQLYYKCFQEFEFVFAKDVYHATQIAGYLENKKMFDSLYSLCCLKGISYKVLNKTKLIKNLLNKDSVKYFKIYKTQNNIYLSKLDLKLRSELKKRYAEEQKAKLLPGTKIYREVVNQNYDRLRTIIKSGSFPGEHLIGIDYGNLDPKYPFLDKDMEISNDFVYGTLLHYPFAYSELKKELHDALKKGKTSPEMVAYLYSFEQTRNGVLYPHQNGIDSIKYPYSYNMIEPYSNNKSKINADRKAIGLCSIETEEKKKFISLKIGFVF